MKKVIVTADAAGNVVVPSKSNPEYGHIRVQQERMLIDEKGFARAKTISALIPGTLKDLQAFGWSKGQEVEGKIIFKEQLKPFNEKEPERDHKVAGKTGIICTYEGSPIYRKTFYSIDEKAVDCPLRDSAGNLISHDNSDDIKAAYITLKEKEVLSKSEISSSLE